jgi:uncharacterized membrane protein YidH (DUF202 family)
MDPDLTNVKEPMTRRVRDAAETLVTIELTAAQIVLVVFLAIMYIITASMAINTFTNCDELKGKTLQENLNKWLIATLAISITIPITLLITKTAGTKLSGVFLILFGIMGIIGGSAGVHWTGKCKDEDRTFSIVSLTGFVLVLLAGLFFFRPEVTE